MHYKTKKKTFPFIKIFYLPNLGRILQPYPTADYDLKIFRPPFRQTGHVQKIGTLTISPNMPCLSHPF